MKQSHNKTIKNKGFALIEILTAVFIFSIIVGAASGLFISAIRSQRNVLASQELLDQTSYAMEYMSRALRMTKKDLSGNCLTTAGAKNNYENPSGDSSIRFLDYNDKCHEFLKEGNQLKEKKSTDNTAGNLPVSGTPLTSADLKITSLNFNLSGESQIDNLQPRVTISLDVQGKEQSKLKIQTTISQRNLDTVY